MAESFEFESMSLFEINFLSDMLGKLDKLGLGDFQKKLFCQIITKES